MKIIAEYPNGNYHVALHSDGTKVRTHDGSPKAEFPESIDLKITDYCDAGCAWCHEKSTREGKHASAARIAEVVKGLPAGVEIAIGGGNPMEHPALVCILSDLRDKGLIPNLTVNGVHLQRFREQLLSFRRRKLFFGLGVSFAPRWMHQAGRTSLTKGIFDNDTVIHLIAGVNSLRPLMERWFPGRKFLVLGYKRFGFGLDYEKRQHDRIERELDKWRYWIGKAMSLNHISFDNLALEQLEVRQWIAPKVWESAYMGNDGQFTMYVDAVRNEFAVSSTSPRQPLGRMVAREAFLQL